MTDRDGLFALSFAAMLIDSDANAEIVPLEHSPACPFCGNQNPVVISRRGCAVVCGQCGAHGPKTGSPGEAVQQWTRRPVTVPASEDVKRACPHCAATVGLQVRLAPAHSTLAVACGRCAAQGPICQHPEGAVAHFGATTRWNERAADYHDQGFDDQPEGVHG